MRFKRGMMQGMGRLSMFLFAIEVLLVVLALISCLSAEDGEVRALPRYVWIILILLFPLVGAIVYFAAGRPLATTHRPGVWRQGSGFPEATRPQRSVAPDDDPEFLKSLRSKQAKEDEELLRRWEDDLRRREEDLRNRDKKGEDASSTDS